MNGRPVRVVIIGAGPTGIAAATLLAQYGVECLVLERWEGVYPLPRAVHEIYRILARLGIGREFAQISRTPEVQSTFLRPCSAPRPPARGLTASSPPPAARSNDSAAPAGPARTAGGRGDEARNPTDRPGGQTGGRPQQVVGTIARRSGGARLCAHRDEPVPRGGGAHLDVITTQAMLLGNEVTQIQLQGRRMAAAVLLIQALGGGWSVAELPTAREVTTRER